MKQLVISGDGIYDALDTYFRQHGVHNLLVVCGSTFRRLQIRGYLAGLAERLGIAVTTFSDFQPNPGYGSIVKGVEALRAGKCDAIFAVGGGSAMDVAKCIKLYAGMNPRRNYLEQTAVASHIPLAAMPTTAGTGSEATRYAVIYHNGEKQSVTHDSILPDAVVLDPAVLRSLPDYQRRATMLDALCHSIEAWWSVNSSEESRGYSRQALKDILQYKDAYLANENEGNAKMLLAAHTAGRAINLTQTTAGHAMCYKLTGMYGIAHGHAAALCVAKLWPYMLRHTEDCTDPRGRGHLRTVFTDMAHAFGCRDAEEAPARFQAFLDSLGLCVPTAEERDFEILASSVNPVRLKNNPVRLDRETLEYLYREILKDTEAES